MWYRYRETLVSFIQRSKHSIFFVFILTSLSFPSQAVETTFYSLSQDIEFSSNSVDVTGDTILQDKRGFLWFGTQNGLNRFDGYNTTIYQHQSDNINSISNSYIRSLYEDSQGYIWIGTGNGLNRFDPLTQTFLHFQHQPEDSKSISSNRTTAMLEDKPGKLWIGTIGEGLNYFDTLTKTSTRIQTPENIRTIKNLLKDKSGRLWIGSNNGLYHYNLTTNEFVHYPLSKNRATDNERIIIQSLFEDRNGNLWVGSNNGLHHFDKSKQQFIKLSYPPSSEQSIGDIQSIVDDTHGGIWIGDFGGGLHHYNQSTKQLTNYRNNTANPNSLCGDYISVLYRDNLNRIWVGTNGNQAFCYFAVDQRRMGFNRPLSKNPVSSILKDSKNQLWLGLFGEGLEQLNLNTRQHTHYRSDQENKHSLSADRVMALHEDKNGTLWVGTYGGGLNRYDSITQQFEQFENSPTHILTLASDERGRLWVGSADKGLHQFDKNTHRFISHNDGGKIDYGVGVIYSNNKGTLWAASEKGFFSFQPDLNRYHYYQHSKDTPNSLSDNYVQSFHEDNNNSLWIGTFTGGLNRLNLASGEFTHYRKKDGLPSDTIDKIFADIHGGLWLAHNKGISRFDADRKTTQTFRVVDGLQEGSFLGHHITENGEILLSGENGYNRFFPHQIKLRGTPPSVLITDFLLNNQSVPVKQTTSTNTFSLEQSIYNTKKILLTHKEHFFSFKFAAINAPKPKYIRYAYKLEGWDQDWIYTNHKNRTASYTNISAGDYKLKIKAIDMDGIWGESSTSIKITILPPLWKTTFAYISYLVLIIITMIIIVNVRTRVLKQRAYRLEQTIKSRTKTIESLLSKKDEFFANVSHEFRTPLTLINGPITQVLNETHSKKIKNLLAPTLNSSKHLLRMVDQILDLTRLDNSEIDHRTVVNLSATLENTTASMHSLFKDKNLALTTRIHPNLLVVATQDGIEKIAVNLLSNAIKYTEQGGSIIVNANRKENSVFFTVKDTGLGIATHDQDKIFERFVRLNTQSETSTPGAGIGLALVKQLVINYNGTINVDSKLNSGSCFSVDFPLAPSPPTDHNTPIVVSHTIKQEIEALRHSATTPMTDPEPAQHLTHDVKPWVLIIEDHPQMRLFIQQGLEKNYHCLLAKDGEEGIEMAIEHVPDVIITDLMMPNKSGFEVSRVVRNNICSSHIPIIMLTASADTQSRLQAWKSDIDEYIEKPFNSDELLLRCNNLINIRRILSQRYSVEINHNINNAACSISEKDKVFTDKLKNIISIHYENQALNAKLLCREMAMSESQLQRKIKALLGQSIPDYIRTYRLHKAAELLKSTQCSVTEIAFNIGFSSSAYFSRCFKAHYGSSPKIYRETLLDPSIAELEPSEAITK